MAQGTLEGLTRRRCVQSSVSRAAVASFAEYLYALA